MNILDNRQANLMRAQLNRDMCRGQLLEAEMLLNDAQRMMDVHEPFVPTPVPPRNEVTDRLQTDSLMSRVRGRTILFFKRPAIKPVRRGWRRKVGHAMRRVANWIDQRQWMDV